MYTEAMMVVPWPIKLLIKSQAVKVVFDYVRSVPVPKSLRMRVLTKGLGRWRWGTGSEVEVRYKE